MTKRMLIDASHAEETRVVVLDGNRLEDFDVETSTKKQLKGNIYLAKVVRVEPSLQAAFVDYGGGRHGFLAFSEIHPDYYQIPVADRQRLLEMQAQEAREEEDAEEDEEAPPAVRRPATGRSATAAHEQAAMAEAAAAEATVPHEADFGPPERNEQDLAEPAAEESTPTAEAPAVPDQEPPTRAPEAAAPEAAAPGTAAPGTAAPEEPEGEGEPGPRAQPATIPHEVRYGELDFAAVPADLLTAEPESEGPKARGPKEAEHEEAEEPAADLPPPETIGGETDSSDEVRARRAARFLRNYRIQEVIKRRQIMLVQVVKEERGTKGAALTSYISLAGRFCVLMPNSPRGGGISRKITSAADRKRLKEITSELEIPQGMGLIVRTAGANRPKPEIKRDCEYLMRLWDDIREHTLRSVAPTLIYEEASLIKRAIRDVYSRDIDEIMVDGEEGWRAAHDFMRMLMPSHARKVQLWRDSSQSLFGRHQVEAQLDAMMSPTVQLKSGGYLVINQAEALVAIDVNSGRSTRERGIEETALRTNLEAADEVARQLRLRDLAGLIVIDFIDMEAKKNNAAVERRLKEALKIDRARIQVGHISHFGLLEMSRQRLRPSLAETSFVPCPHCGGLGHVRSTESSALHVLRTIEDEGAKDRASLVQVSVASAVIMYIVNHKRDRLAEIESRSGMRVQFVADEQLVPPQMRLDRLRGPVTEAERPAAPVVPAAPEPLPEPVEAVTEPEEAEETAPAAAEAEPGEPREEGRDETRRRRRRRRRRGGREAGAGGPGTEEGEEEEEEAVLAPASEEQPEVPRGAFPVVPEPVVPKPAATEATTPEPAAPAEAAPAEAVSAHAAPPEAAPAEAAEAETGGATAPTEAGEGEEGDGRRRRGRRGGRRRRHAEPETPAEAAAPPVEVPVWTGPTPADPFGGQAYDIFDLIEQQEQSRAGPAEQPPPAEPAAADRAPSSPVPGSADVPEPASHITVPMESPAAPEEAQAVEVSTPEAPEPPPVPAEATPQQAQGTGVAAGRPEPVVGPAVKPVVVGHEQMPTAERKRGWWRR